MTTSECERRRRLGSLVLDGEASPRQASRWHAHEAGCADCSAWARTAVQLRRTAAIAVAPSASAAVQVPPIAVRSRLGLRLTLLVVTLVQLGLAVAELASPEHDLHETSSAGIAIGVGVLLAVWRPSRAAGAVGVVAAFALLLLATTALDAWRGEVHLRHEIPHLLVAAEATLLAVLSRTSPRLPRRGTGARLPLRRAA